MHWIAPTEKDAASATLEKRLWDAADQFRANSGLKAQEYSGPILGLIFLRFAEVRFAAQRAKLEAAGASSRRGSRVDELAAYHADNVLYLAPEARFDHLLTLPEAADIGGKANAAMREVEKHNPQLAGVLPKTFNLYRVEAPDLTVGGEKTAAKLAALFFPQRERLGAGGAGASRRLANALFSPLPEGERLGVRAHHKHVPAAHIAFARQLRQQQTDAEGLIWHLLRDRRLGGFKFRRQHPLPLYVLDFYCHELALCIELDGAQHADRAEQEARRDEALAAQGIRTLRFWNNEVLAQTEAVLDTIWRVLHEPSAPIPTPLPVYRDVPGLCKAALAGIEAQGWSLNPGRYVDVAPGEEASDEDFKTQLETLNEELEKLNAQARELEQTIARNVAGILGV